MSFKAMNWATQQKAGGPGAKLVLVMLANFASDVGESHYSNTKLAATCEMSVDTLQRHLSALEALGLIARIPTFRSDGSQATNQTICLFSSEARDEAQRRGWSPRHETPGTEPPAICGAPPRKIRGTPPRSCGAHMEPSNNQSPPLPPTRRDGQERRLAMTWTPKGPESGLAPGARASASEGLGYEGRRKTSAGHDDTFERFKAVWRFAQGESERSARTEFLKLTTGDRTAAIAGATAFQAAMAGRRNPPHASTYLRERKWTYSQPRSSPPRAPSPSTPAGEPEIFLRPGSPQLAAWHAFERRCGGRAQLSLHRPSEWPPGHNSP